jgi:sialic acid synthase SpsE
VPGGKAPAGRAEVSGPEDASTPQHGGPYQQSRHEYRWAAAAAEANIPYLILDIGGNPSGDPALAASMVKAAAAAGAPAVKFQAYTVKDFIHPRNKSYNEMLQGEMPYGLIEDMAKLAHDLGMQCGVTVFSPEGIDRALACKADFIKIASGDINYLGLIREAAGAGPPLVMSTGASTSKDVRRVLGLLNSMEKWPAALLQCTSLYPAPAASCYLAVMADWLAQGLPAGFSDHSMGISGPMFAYALGAITVEKHFTVDRTLPGGDNFMSLLPEHVKIITSSAKSLMPPGAVPILASAARESIYFGQRVKRVFHGEDRRSVRRTACAARRLPKGTLLRTHNLKFLRLGCEFEGHYLGPGSPYKDAKLLRDVELLEPISEDMVAPAPRWGVRRPPRLGEDPSGGRFTTGE